MTMPRRYVIDSSVYMKHLIPDPLSDQVDDLLACIVQPGTELFVPDLFYIECTNVLWKYIRAGQYNIADLSDDLMELQSLPFQAVCTSDLMIDAINIAVVQSITAYDACYVALAHQVSAPLLTLDIKLVNKMVDTPYDVRNFSLEPFI
jgi:predicted nucleic acid-binding protein